MGAKAGELRTTELTAEDCLALFYRKTVQLYVRANWAKDDSTMEGEDASSVN